jgi:hypothetical protein
VDPRTGLDNVEKRKFLPYWDSNSDPSVVQLVAIRYTDYAIQALDTRGRQLNSLLVAGFCEGVARNGLIHCAVLFPFHFPSFAQVHAIT